MKTVQEFWQFDALTRQETPLQEAQLSSLHTVMISSNF